MKDSSFWDGIKTRLKNRRATQEALAEYLKVSPSVVRSWIARNSIPDAVRAVQIAHFLQTSVEELTLQSGVLKVRKYSFGSRLRECLARKGYTVRDLADLSMVPISTLEVYLGLDTPPPDILNLVAMARYLDVSMYYLSVQVWDHEDTNWELRRLIFLLSEKDRLLVAEFANRIYQTYER